MGRGPVVGPRSTSMLALVFVVAVLMTGMVSTTKVARAATEPSSLQSACGAAVNAEPSRPRQINLVLDDSGSMFVDSGGPLDRWSVAKYSVEVFAAMLAEQDELSVYRMSDFADGANAGPAVTLSGTEPASARVAKIHDMQMIGGGTPYAPVTRAYADLTKAAASDKWLVILTDGEFNDRSSAQVGQDMRTYVEENRREDGGLRVAFLAIGDEAPTLANDPEGGVFFDKAKGSADLLERVTGFSNLIFERSLIRQTGPGRIAPDIALAEALVFAQGQNVEIGDASVTGGASIAPSSTVEVSWTTNQPARSGSAQLEAVPNENLRGKLATFDDVPRGDVVVDISGAQTIDIFYKPQIDFGIELLDADGVPVDADKILGGTYTLFYGFMDAQCEFVESDLLGSVEYTARVFHDGDVVVDNFKPGDSIELDRGQVSLEVGARYLGGSTSNARIDLTVLRPARPAVLEFDQPVFAASELAGYTPPQGAITVTYAVRDAAGTVPFSAEEWATVGPDSFTVTSDSNIEFDVSVGDEIGTVYLTPRAPGGDVYAADTGDITVTVAAAHVFDEQLNEVSADVTVQIEDDISWWDRFAEWFATTGWKLLALAAAVVLLLGYVFKRRFSQKIRRRPSVVGTPNRVGVRPENGAGRFTVRRGRKLLPFVADKATLTFVPAGVTGFRPMKLRAGPRKTMVLENWRQLAERKNVAINGTELDEETTRAPSMSPSSTITATTPQMTYESTPNA